MHLESKKNIGGSSPRLKSSKDNVKKESNQHPFDSIPTYFWEMRDNHDPLCGERRVVSQETKDPCVNHHHIEVPQADIGGAYASLRKVSLPLDVGLQPTATRLNLNPMEPLSIEYPELCQTKYWDKETQITQQQEILAEKQANSKMASRNFPRDLVPESHDASRHYFDWYGQRKGRLKKVTSTVSGEEPEIELNSLSLRRTDVLRSTTLQEVAKGLELHYIDPTGISPVHDSVCPDLESGDKGEEKMPREVEIDHPTQELKLKTYDKEKDRIMIGDKFSCKALLEAVNKVKPSDLQNLNMNGDQNESQKLRIQNEQLNFSKEDKEPHLLDVNSDDERQENERLLHARTNIGIDSYQTGRIFPKELGRLLGEDVLSQVGANEERNVDVSRLLGMIDSKLNRSDPPSLSNQVVNEASWKNLHSLPSHDVCSSEKKNINKSCQNFKSNAEKLREMKDRKDRRVPQDSFKKLL